jgi:hypothetical protein
MAQRLQRHRQGDRGRNTVMRQPVDASCVSQLMNEEEGWYLEVNRDYDIWVVDDTSSRLTPCGGATRCARDTPIT